MTAKRVLVAPLNWGLGHATRCIPIIRLLLERGHEVMIASDGDSLAVLKKEFPSLRFFQLPPYNIQYSRNIPAWLYTFWRAPKVIRGIKQEHTVVEDIVRGTKPDWIIADNRYGCWSRKAKTIFITHQINLLMPEGMRWSGWFVNFFHRMSIRKFNHVWIPDSPEHVLSGELTKTDASVEFIGTLSRFKKSKQVEHKNEIAVVLSGPEPQRTLLEKNLLPQVIELNLPTVFVRGMINETMGESEVGQVKIINYLSSTELQQVIEQSKIIVARSGYSTVMDLAVLQKKAIFIPTPGQPEQEYLATAFMQKKIAYAVDQEKLDLYDALEQSEEYSGFETDFPDDFLRKAFEKLSL